MKVEIRITNGKGEPKTFQLEDVTPKDDKGRKFTQFKPSGKCTEIAPFTKVYIPSK
jgi:hypothetical protein